MTPADYKIERQRRGTLKGAAALLGIHWTTLARRESGVIELTIEMALAMRSLPLRKTKDSRKGTNNKLGNERALASGLPQRHGSDANLQN